MFLDAHKKEMLKDFGNVVAVGDRSEVIKVAGVKVRFFE